MNFLGRLHQCRTDKAESNKTWMTLENRYLQVKNLLTCLCARIASQILSMKKLQGWHITHQDTLLLACKKLKVSYKMLSLQHHVMLILVTKKGSHPFWEIGRYLLVSSTHLPGPQHVASTPRKYRRHVRKTWIRFSHGHHGFSPTFWGWRSSNFPFFSSVLVRITMTFTISGWSQWGFTGNRWSAFGSLRFGEVCPMTFQGSVCF